MHLHLPHLPVPLVMLSFVYATAIAVALAHSGRPTLGALVVLAGLTARWVARHRRSEARATVAVLPAEVEPSPSTAPA
ncbi:hypothetical protein [Blastococcus mobilis]|uniref:Uncharacterized protein n=1 Tax=Blastococcus mobilis TaxID=1938746 RepID=A0A238WLJ4_9ACTN|nr:hypothetical protein [Blastococcus mobilis]SNR47440.1 hypothetical protein SAMN06272737_108156 [Blastococcus mobilis]